jgi:hypothetical protein
MIVINEDSRLNKGTESIKTIESTIATKLIKVISIIASESMK